MNKIKPKTNVTTDVIYDEIKSALKSDKRVWSLSREESNDGYLCF